MIENHWAEFGEHVALLHHYAGGDPGYKNVLDDRVRGAARSLVLKAHDDVCLDCMTDVVDPTPEYIATVELRRRRCAKRLRIVELA